MPDPQIFVSHSQKDQDIRSQFDTIFARARVRSVCMEFEQIYPPFWEGIKNEINMAKAVFLLLGPNIPRSIHTQNWVAFEVGVACALGKDVWVFEQQDAHIGFPVPYLTDYMICNLDYQNHFDYVRSIVEGYGRTIPIFPLDGDARTKRNIPPGEFVYCEGCGTEYSLHTKIASLYCPSCRRQLQ